MHGRSTAGYAHGPAVFGPVCAAVGRDDTEGVNETLVTGFGAALGSPQQTAAVLRARASAAGVNLQAASVPDLAAAVLAAHCWTVLCTHQSPTGSMPVVHAAALAPVLLRVGGHPQPVSTNPAVSDLPDLSAAQLSQVVPVARWALQHGGTAALRAAAADLHDSAEASLRAAAELFDSWADDELCEL